MGSVFSWVATIIALAGTILNCKKIKWCFWLWTLTNAMWLIYDIKNGTYPRAVLDFVQLVLAIYGIKEWSK